MADHLLPATLLDLAEGQPAPSETRAHLASCPACRAQIEQLQQDLALLPEVDVPEPSPLYWAAFRRELADRVRELPTNRRAERWLWAPALAAAAVAVVVLLPRTARAPQSPRSSPGGAYTLPVWSALPAAAQDESLVVLQALAAEGTMGPDSECMAVEDCLADLGDDDVPALTEALRAADAGEDL